MGYGVSIKSSVQPPFDCSPVHPLDVADQAHYSVVQDASKCG